MSLKIRGVPLENYRAPNVHFINRISLTQEEKYEAALMRQQGYSQEEINEIIDQWVLARTLDDDA